MWDFLAWKTVFFSVLWKPVLKLMRPCISKCILFLNKLFLKTKTSLVFWLKKARSLRKLFFEIFSFVLLRISQEEEYFRFFNLFPTIGRSRDERGPCRPVLSQGAATSKPTSNWVTPVGCFSCSLWMPRLWSFNGVGLTDRFGWESSPMPAPYIIQLLTLLARSVQESNIPYLNHTGLPATEKKKLWFILQHKSNRETWESNIYKWIEIENQDLKGRNSTHANSQLPAPSLWLLQYLWKIVVHLPNKKCDTYQAWVSSHVF